MPPPRSDHSHKPDARAASPVILVHPPTRSRSGRPARPHRGTLSRGQAAQNPCHANAVAGTGRDSARERGRRAGSTAERGHAPDGTPRTPTARDSLRTARTPGPARRDPPPTRKGEARATVGDEPRSAPHHRGRGPAEPSLSSPLTPSRGKRRRVRCKRVATASATITYRERRRTGGSGTPRHASRIAREAFLTEGGSHSPPASRPSSGPQGLSGTPGDGREGPAVRGKKTCVRQTSSVRGQGGGTRRVRMRATPRGTHPVPSTGLLPSEAKHLRSKPTRGRSEAGR